MVMARLNRIEIGMDENNKNLFGDRLIRLPELTKIFGVCKRTVRRKAEVGELPTLVHSGGVVGMLESKVKEHFQRLGRQGTN